MSPEIFLWCIKQYHISLASEGQLWRASRDLGPSRSGPIIVGAWAATPTEAVRILLNDHRDPIPVNIGDVC